MISYEAAIAGQDAIENAGDIIEFLENNHFNAPTALTAMILVQGYLIDLICKSNGMDREFLLSEFTRAVQDTMDKNKRCD